MRHAYVTLVLLTLLPSGCGDEFGYGEGFIGVQPLSMVSSWNTDGTVRVEGDIDIFVDSWTPNTYALDTITITAADFPSNTPYTLHVEVDESQWPIIVTGEGAAEGIARRIHFVATGEIPPAEIGFCPTETLYNIQVEALTLDGSASGSSIGTASHDCPPCAVGAETIAPELDWLSESQQPAGKVDAVREVFVDPNGDVFMVILSVEGLYLERVGPDDEFKRIEFDPLFATFTTMGRLTTGTEPGALVYSGDFGVNRVLSRLNRSGAVLWTHNVGNGAQNNAFAVSEGRLFFTIGDGQGGTLDGTTLPSEGGRTMLASADEATGTVIATSSTEMHVIDMLPGPNGTFAVLGSLDSEARVEMFDRDLTWLWGAPMLPSQTFVPAVVSESGHVFVAASTDVWEYGPDVSEVRFSLPFQLTSLTRTDDGSLLAGGPGTASKLLANGKIEPIVGGVDGGLPWCPASIEYRLGYGGSSPAIAFVTFNELGAPNLFAGRIAP